MKKFRPWLLALIVLGGLGYLLYKGITKPLPGETVTEVGGGKLSQEHVTDIFGVTYTSNPPAGGKHFPIWAKPGVYDELISDGYFIHSMEHGYIIVWYNCDKLYTTYQLIPSALAHEGEVQESSMSATPLMHMTAQVAAGTSWVTPKALPEIEVELPESYKSEACKNLVSELSGFTNFAQRVIVTPRLNMDTPIALTAWGRILKLNSVDKGMIENFISTFHNRGPEQTME